MNDNVTRIRDRLRQSSPLSGGGNGGTYDGMEARVSKLEVDMQGVALRLAGIEQKMATKDDITAIRTDIAEMKGRLGGMPTTWQMIGVFATMNGLLLAGATLVIAASRFIGS